MKPALLAMLLAGCASFTQPQYSAEILREDAAGCAANPRPLPACVIGVMVFGRWKF